MDNGFTIVVESGVLVSVAETVAEEPEEAAEDEVPAEDAPAASGDTVVEQEAVLSKAEIDAIKAELATANAELTAVKTELETTKAELAKAKKAPISKPVSQKEIAKLFNKNTNEKLSNIEKIAAQYNVQLPDAVLAKLNK